MAAFMAVLVPGLAVQVWPAERASVRPAGWSESAAPLLAGGVGAHPGALPPARRARLGRGREASDRGRRPGRAPGDRLLQPRRQLRLPGLPRRGERSLRKRALLPRLREAEPGAMVLADGFSCRTQIHELDSGGREAMHLAELLATAGGLDHNHPERTAAPPPGPATPDSQGRRPGRNRRRPGRRRGGSGRRRHGGPLGAHPRRRSRGEVAPVHQESAAYRAGGGPGVTAILI